MPRQRLTIFLTIAAALAITGLLFAIDPIRDAVSAAFQGDLGAMRDELDSLGALAALVLVGIALVHAIVPFPAEFPTAAAGFVFGFALGFPLMVFAWTLSCLVAYALARGIGPPLLDRLAGKERMEATDRLIARGGWPILLAGRLIPVVPYNLVSYAAGATRVPLGRFTWTTAVGVAPLTALTALLGQRLQEPRFDDPVLWLILLGVLVLLALARPVGRRLRATHQS
ncbi:MAG TPA: VTT domain-containing protein [Solirubrobacteraceae bacterium]|nr:VTT domain-containing protein [Solirubrobacteraceae bacterium]